MLLFSVRVDAKEDDSLKIDLLHFVRKEENKVQRRNMSEVHYKTLPNLIKFYRQSTSSFRLTCMDDRLFFVMACSNGRLDYGRFVYTLNLSYL